jgi:hypothetical protein
VLRQAELRANGNTCKDWFDHVYTVVPSYGDFSVDYDVHDLIERWTNENKLLRNDLAAQFVAGHALDCDSACCVSYANSLVAEWEDRSRQQLEKKDTVFKVKGNSSLRGKLEIIGV